MMDVLLERRKEVIDIETCVVTKENAILVAHWCRGVIAEIDDEYGILLPERTFAPIGSYVTKGPWGILVTTAGCEHLMEAT